jgi:hypothetical protein
LIGSIELGDSSRPQNGLRPGELSLIFKIKMIIASSSASIAILIEINKGMITEISQWM